MGKDRREEAIKRVGSDIYLPGVTEPDYKDKTLDPEYAKSLEECLPELDDKVRPIITDLVNSGYATNYSCQGGKGHENKKGVIYLDDDFIESPKDLRQIREIVRKHTQVPFRIVKGSIWGEGYGIQFKEAL